MAGGSVARTITLFSDEQWKNALFTILLMLEGMITAVRFLQLSNAY